jgi:hypothetical protein
MRTILKGVFVNTYDHEQASVKYEASHSNANQQHAHMKRFRQLVTLDTVLTVRLPVVVHTVDLDGFLLSQSRDSRRS